MMNTVLGNVLELIRTNIGTLDAPWMNRIASRWRFSRLIALCLKPSSVDILDVSYVI